ncbi:hypothetical protein AWZ03_014974, partial [Drosophila navojoa]
MKWAPELESDLELESDEV